MRDVPTWSEAMPPDAMRAEWRKPIGKWSQLFLLVVGRLLAQELLDAFLEHHDDEQVRERFREVIDRVTTGQKDSTGRVLGPFDGP
jgi:hypothetical protein